MPATREMLEGEAYWGQIRALKFRLFLAEAILIVALGALIVFLVGDFQTSPFFIAVDRLLWFVLIMLLVIMLESIIFRVMQLRLAKSDSKKHMMTINSMKKAFIILLFSSIVGVLFVAPATAGAIEDGLSFNGQLTAGSPQQFLTGDPMGLSTIESISLFCESGATVYVLTEYIYLLHQNEWGYLREVALNDVNSVNDSLTVDTSSLSYMYLYIVIDPTETPQDAAVSYTLNRSFTDTLTTFVPLMMMVFALSNVAWIIYLWPLRKKYAGGSIYK